jgi:hypothetical protein
LRLIDLTRVPTWAFWALAITGNVIFAAVMFRIAQMPRRTRVAGQTFALFGVVIVGPAVSSHDPRMVLWFTALGLGVCSLPLLGIGRLPADMPDARDPACRRHPQYDEVARRGRAAGIALCVLIVAMMPLSVIFVRGL